MPSTKKISFLLFGFLLFASFKVKATSIAGSHIGYKAIDSTKYEVILTLYRDCNSINLSTIKIGVTGKSTGFFESVMTKTSTTDITGAYLNCNFISRCTGSYAYGFEKVIYKDTVDISGGACEYRFSYQECCRNSNITTGAANKFHYNYAIVNKCFGLNNSVQADLEPRLLVPVGEDVLMTTFIGDNVDTQDSVRYKQVDPYSDSLSSIQYSGAWSALKPLSCLGFPANFLTRPAGVHFDNLTSDLFFRPMVQNQVTVFCHEAKEYREINGKMEVVGLTRMDYQIIVVPTPNNKPPTILGQSAIACANQKTCISLETADTDTSDSTYLSFRGLPQGATVTYGRKGKLATADICFVPTQNQVRNNPYSFVAIVSDNSCSVDGRNTRTLSFTVRPAPDSSGFKIVSKTPKCNSAEIKLDISNSSISYFQLIDEDSNSLSTTNPAKLAFKGTGWKKFYASVGTSTPCLATFTDSVFINPPYTLNLNTKKDTSFCGPALVTLSSTPTNGTAPFRHIWQEKFSTTKDTITNLTKNYTTAGKTTFFVEVEDDNNCIAYDSVKITRFPALTVKTDSVANVCGSSPVQLKTNVTAGTAPFSYLWQPTNSTTDTVTVFPSSPTTYSVTVNDSNGCEVVDTVFVGLFPTPTFNPPPTTQACQGTQTTLAVSNITGQAPYSFTWDGVQGGSSFPVTAQQTKAITIELTDGNGCKASRFTQLVVNPKPDVSLGVDKQVCRGTTQIIRSNVAKGTAPYSYKWSNNATTDSLTLVINSLQLFTLEVTDAKGCIGSDDVVYRVFPKDNIQVVQPQPQCEIGNPIVLSATPNTGVWSGKGVGTNNLFIPSLAGKGIHKLDYNYVSSNNCNESESMYVVVKQAPQVDFTVDKTKDEPNTTFNFTNQTVADTTYTLVWDFGDLGAPGNISQQINPSYTYTQEGLYTVKLTAYNGVCPPQTNTKTAFIEIAVKDTGSVSVGEINDIAVKLYPSPANNNITIEADIEIDEITMFDVVGKKVAFVSKPQSSFMHLINVSALSNGVYTINIAFKNGQSGTYKVSVNH